jgi:gamma-tubulin complex component 4
VSIVADAVVVGSYSRLFQFLLRVKRAQILLQKAWMQQRQFKDRASDTPTWYLRARMAFLLDNLQYYLQVYHMY